MLPAGWLEMYKFAVFGDPIAHSLSPTIHQYFAQAFNLRVDYQAVHVTADALAETLSIFRQAGGVGANITLPHKQATIRYCVSLSERAKVAAAVNTLTATRQGWHGDNTDGAGLQWDLCRQGLALSGSHVLLLGAGGAARGVIAMLLSADVGHITIANRTLANAVSLAESSADNRADAVQLDQLADLSDVDLLINATAAGHSERHFSSALHSSQKPFCYDLSYAAAAAPFLKWAKNRQLNSSDGLGMLVGQAAESFQLWTGVEVSDDIRADVMNRLG